MLVYWSATSKMFSSWICIKCLGTVPKLLSQMVVLHNLRLRSKKKTDPSRYDLIHLQAFVTLPSVPQAARLVAPCGNYIRPAAENGWDAFVLRKACAKRSFSANPPNKNIKKDVDLPYLYPRNMCRTHKLIPSWKKCQNMHPSTGYKEQKLWMEGPSKPFDRFMTKL